MNRPPGARRKRGAPGARASRIALSSLVVLTLVLACTERPPRPPPPAGAEQDQHGGPSPGAAGADAAFSEGEKLVKERKHASAIDPFRKAASLYEAEGDWEMYVRCYNRIGVESLAADALDNAEAALRQALETGRSRFGEAHPETARTHTQMGRLHHRRGRYDLALAQYSEALRIRPAEQDLELARLYNYMGNAHYGNVDLEEALASHDQALAIQLARGGPQHPDVADTYRYKAQAFWLKGDYEGALTFFQDALAIQGAAGGEQSAEVAGVYGNIGNVYWGKGDYDQAIAYYEKSLAIQRRTLGERHADVATTYHNMAISHLQKGDYEQCLALENRALPIRLAVFGERHPDVAESYLTMGLAHSGKNELDRALDLFRKSLAIQVAIFGPDHPDLAMSYSNIGDVHLKKKNFAQALEYRRKTLSLELAAFGRNHPEVAEDYLALGNVYAARGDHDQALELYQRSLRANVPGFNTADPHASPPLDGVLSEERLLETLERKASAFGKRYRQSGRLGDLEAAHATYELCARLIHRMRGGYQAEGSKYFLAEKATSIYDGAVKTALQLEHLTRRPQYRAAAFLLAEESKVGILLEAMAQAEARQFAGIPPDLLERERQLRIDLAYYDGRLSEERLSAGSEGTRLAPLQEKVFALKQAYDDLRQRFQREYPAYYDLKYPVGARSVPEVQAELLDEKTALVEYFVGTDTIFIFAVTTTAFEVAAVPRDPSLESETEALRQGILARDFAGFAEPARRLYQLLVEPVAGTVAGKRLILVPHGPLSALPFEALLTRPLDRGGGTEDYARLPFLLDEHAVSYAYSTTLLAQARRVRRSLPTRDYVAFAPVFAQGIPAETRGAELITRALTRPGEGGRPGYLPASRKEVQEVLHRFQTQYGPLDRWFGGRSAVYADQHAGRARV